MSKKLVAYFSASGVTKKQQKWSQKQEIATYMRLHPRYHIQKQI